MVTLFVGVIIFISLFVFSDSAPQKTAQMPFALKDEDVAKLQSDEDHDGLKDWEEAIFRTNPRNPDTDGDGTMDGEELKQGRDPLVKGPEDARATSTAFKINSSSSVPENFTKFVAQRFGEKFILPLLRDTHAKPDPQAIAQELSQEVLSASREPPKDLLAKQDLLISSDNSNAAIKTFVQTIDTIIVPISQQRNRPAVIIFSEALQNEDFSKLNEMDSYLSVFNPVMEKLKKLSVPSELISLQLNYLNLAIREHQAVAQMRNAEKDLIGALIAAKDYGAATDDYKALLVKFDKEFKKRGIIF